MKNLSFNEFRTLVSDVKNSEDKKTQCMILGLLLAAFAITVGVIYFLVKKQGGHGYDDLYDDWDDEEDYFDDDCESCDDDCNCEENK